MGQRREVYLVGNVFVFDMPEDFSRDMPAEPLVERVNGNSGASPVQIVRRWWDIKSNGFFPKAFGSVMMNIELVKVPANTLRRIHDQPYDIRDRLDFILALDEMVRSSFSDTSSGAMEGGTYSYTFPSVASILGNTIETEYRDYVFNGQKWTGYSVGGPFDQLIAGYALPITDDYFLNATFTYSPNNGIPPMEFRRLAYPKMRIIQESFRVRFSETNDMRQTVEAEWIAMTADDVLENKKSIIVLPLFGPEVQRQLN